MRVLYLIFSHDHQVQLARLVAAITRLSPDALIAVHHDPIGGALGTDVFGENRAVHVIPNPVRGEWGDFSLVAQYLHALRWCEDNLEFAWICTLTGLSYPIKDLQGFEQWLGNSGYDAFVRHFDAFDPGPWPKGVWPKGTGETRYLYRYFKLPRISYYYKVPAEIRHFLSTVRRVLNDSQSLLKIVPMPRGGRTRLGLRRLRLPVGRDFRLCGGRQMLNLNRRALRRVLKFVVDHPYYSAYFKRTLIPDEGFFTSILANDADLRVCNDILRYIKWPKPIGASSIAVITAAEVDEAMKSGAPFALKFDMRQHPAALDRVDSLLALRTQQP